MAIEIESGGWQLGARGGEESCGVSAA